MESKIQDGGARRSTARSLRCREMSPSAARAPRPHRAAPPPPRAPRPGPHLASRAAAGAQRQPPAGRLRVRGPGAALPPPVPGRPHLIAPEPRRPRRRRVAAPGEPLGRRPGTVEGHEKECPRPGGGTPRRLAPPRPPLLLLRDSAGGGGETRERNESPAGCSRRRRDKRRGLRGPSRAVASLGSRRRDPRRAVKGSLRPSLPFKSRLEAASPCAPRAPPRPDVSSPVWSPALGPWRRCTHRGQLPSQDAGHPWGLGRLLAHCVSRLRRGEVAPRRRASLLWEWVSSEADTPFKTMWAARAFHRAMGEGGGGERAFIEPLASQGPPAIS